MRADIDVDTLLKIVLVLAVVWLALEIVGEILGVFSALFAPFSSLLGLTLIVLIVLYLLDRI